MSRFVKPETAVLKISNNETLVVKKRLNRGEKGDMYLRMGAPGEHGLGVDVPLERVLAYLTDWTVVDDDGRPMPYRDLDRAGRVATLKNLDDDDFSEIKQAVDQHIADMEAERSAEKKASAGANGSVARSRSADGSGSPSATSTNSTQTSTPSV